MHRYAYGPAAAALLSSPLLCSPLLCSALLTSPLSFLDDPLLLTLPTLPDEPPPAQSVFVIQCEGSKSWELFEPPQRWRLRFNQRGKAGDVTPESELQQPLGTFTLHPGDVLFVPRGIYHRTATLLPPPQELPATEGLLPRRRPLGALATPHDEPPPSPPSAPSLHITVGVETDTDDWTWLSLLKDVASALRLSGLPARLDAAQWHDERLRAALPLPLCRLGASITSTEPHVVPALATARELLADHGGAGASKDMDALRKALDAGLRKRQDHVEKKRQQLADFVTLNERHEAL